MSFLACAPGRVLEPYAGVLACGNDGAGIARRNCCVAALCVIGTIGMDLVQQFREHRRIPYSAACDLDDPYLQRVGIDAQMDFAPLAGLGWPMFLGKPISFALDPGAFDLEVQRTHAGPIAEVVRLI